MSNRHLILLMIFSTILLGCCYQRIEISGQVINSTNKTPVDSVRIIYRDEVTYSDASGNFQIIIDNDQDTEFFIEKDGFKTMYSYNFSNSKKNKKMQYVFELEPGFYKLKSKNAKLRDFFYYTSLLFIILNFISLIFVLFFKKPIVHKLVWVVVFLFLGNFCIEYHQLIQKVDTRMFCFLFTGIHKYSCDILYLPIGTIAFWTIEIIKWRKNKRHITHGVATSGQTEGHRGAQI